MKRIAFLYDQVSGIFYDNRTHGRDRQSNVNAETIKAQVGYGDNIVDVIGEALAYTAELEFHWQEGVPDGVKALEKFWSMYKSGIDIGKCFQFYSDNVDNLVLVGTNEHYKLERVTDTELQLLTASRSIPEMVVETGVLYKSRQDQIGVKGWNRAMNEALKSWTPPDAWKLLRDLPEDQQNDPLLSPNTGASGANT